jgi:hypothetical protein
VIRSIGINRVKREEKTGGVATAERRGTLVSSRDGGASRYTGFESRRRSVAVHWFRVATAERRGTLVFDNLVDNRFSACVLLADELA